VAFGAREMDRVNPIWYREIDTDRLEMASESRCILGQYFGDFEDGAEELGWSAEETVVRGLDLHWDGHALNGFYSELDELWKAEISIRRNADKDNRS
jgi:hypothetical protein